jgi:hypothetical protein
MKKKIFFYGASLLMVCLMWHGYVDAAEYTLMETMPGVGQAGTPADFPKYITGLYNFAIAFSVVSALLMVTLGGFYYIASAGNQAQAGTAKTLIKDALLGMVMVFLTWLILNEINPDLIKAVPDLSDLQKTAAMSAKDHALKNATQARVAVGQTVTGSNGRNYNSIEECKAAGNASCDPLQLKYSKDGVQYKQDTKTGEWYESSEEECMQKDAVCMSGAQIKARFLYNTDSKEQVQEKLKSSGLEVPDRVNVQNLASKTVDASNNVCGSVGCTGMKVVSNPGFSGSNEISLSHGDEDKDDAFIKRVASEANMEKDNGKDGDRDKVEYGDIYTVKKTYVYPQDHKLAGQVVIYEKTYSRGRISLTDELKDTKITIYGDKTNPQNTTFKPSE